MGVDLLGPLVAGFHASGRLRVWSVVITVFGDAVQPRGGRISVARLQAVLGRLGVAPGALRTALSRLAKEGWVDREKQGRVSYYRLSARGVVEFDAASDQIFGTSDATPSSRYLMGYCTGKTDGIAAHSGAIALGPDVFLWPANDAPNGDWLVAHNIVSVAGQLGSKPANVFTRLLSEQQHGEYKSLMQDFASLNAGIAGEMSPLDAFAARILLIHRWRRLVLRNPDIPADLVPDDWPAETCRRVVGSVYRRLLMPSESWLNGPLESGEPAMPPPDSRFAARFSRFSG